MAGFTVKKVFGPEPYGSQWSVCRKVSFDDAYLTGGASLTFGELGMRSPKFVRILPKGGYVFEYVLSTQKVLVYYGDNNNAGDGPLIEVPNTTDLDAVVDVIVEAIGLL